jgi:hypothetical protein
VKLAISSSTPLVGKTRTMTKFLGTDFLTGATILESFESARKSNIYLIKYPVFPELDVVNHFADAFQLVIMRLEWSQDFPYEMQAIRCAKLIIGVARIQVIVV